MGFFSKQERGQNCRDIIENEVEGLKGTFAIYSAKSRDVYSGSGILDSVEMLMGVKEIGGLNATEQFLIESIARLGELKIE